MLDLALIIQVYKCECWNKKFNLHKSNPKKNPACYFMGCPCHLVHNVACKASSFDVEDMCVDVYYYFDKSTKRKSSLVEFAEFCDVKYRQVIKQVNTRWLSLEVAVKRSLQMYPALKSYFLSNSKAEAQFKRLKGHFCDPMVEIYLQFYHAVLPTFTTVNLFLQREDPCIFAVYKQLRNFVKKLLGKFVSIQCIREAEDIKDVEYTKRENPWRTDNSSLAS